MILNDSLTDRKFITNFDGYHSYYGRLRKLLILK
jgi:hypothetical protein